jgi:hypothetical protein
MKHPAAVMAEGCVYQFYAELPHLSLPQPIHDPISMLPSALFRAIEANPNDFALSINHSVQGRIMPGDSWSRRLALKRAMRDGDALYQKLL